MSMRNVILVGDVLDRLREIPDESIHCVVTSPPYWGLRDYGVAGQIGLEATPELFVARMVEVFREVRRVLRSDGTCWVNLGDSYAGSWGAQGREGSMADRSVVQARSIANHPHNTHNTGTIRSTGLKPKDLCGIPWRVALALQADGWYLRSDIIWHKPNPMPESVTDRPTKSHEYLFLLTKSAHYWYDADAVRERQESADSSEFYDPANMPEQKTPTWGIDGSQSLKDKGRAPRLLNPSGRNRRDVWTIATEAFPGAHFATFPRKLVEPCILAGCPAKVCPKCGAGWMTETTREYPPTDRLPAPNKGKLGAIGERAANMTRDGFIPNRVYIDHYAGSHPSCTCGLDPVPGVVLDPFFGSGTVGVVALSLGRQYIGIELNTAYADMARNRIEHGTVDPAEVSEIESQGMLFDMSNSNIMQSPAQEAEHAAP